MKRKSLNISGKIEPSEIEVLKSITRSANALSIDFFIIGATARDLVFGLHDIETGRATQDLDIGIQVESWQQFFQLKRSLLDTGDYVETSQPHKIKFQQSSEIDIVPFGRIAGENETVEWPPDQTIVMKTTGFRDAFNDAFFGELENNPEFRVNIASIPGLAILKIIAWNDDYPNRTKDAIDLEFLLRNYIDAGNTDRFYREGSDLLAEDDFDYEVASSRFLGRNTARISSERTKSEIKGILDGQIGDRERYRLIEDMIRNQRLGKDKFHFTRRLVESFAKGYCDDVS